MSKSPRDDLPGEAKSPGELTFEKALAELERIVNRMEAGEQIGRASCRERV